MKRTNKKDDPLSKQMHRHSVKKIKPAKELEGDTRIMTSTGSTLLDLCIAGGRVHGGGLPGGILAEIFGPSSTGKTVFLSELAGAIQRQEGEVTFHDPEARLDKQFALGIYSRRNQ